MIQWLAELFVEDFSPLNVFRYITFRAAYSTVTALLICFFFGGWAIRKLQEMQIGEQIRERRPAGKRPTQLLTRADFHAVS